MRVYKKTGFIRALVIGVPFGIYALFIGVSKFQNIPNKASGFNTVSGIILKHGTKEYYDQKVDVHREVYFFRIDNIGNFCTELGKHRKYLESLNKDWKNLKAEIWIKEKDIYIKQLKIDNEMIIEYEPPYWMAWFFTIVGGVFIVMSIFYVIKYSSDFFGK